MIIFRTIALCLFVLSFNSAHAQKPPKLYLANFTKEDRIAMKKDIDTGISWARALDNLVGFQFEVKAIYIGKFRFVWLTSDRRAVCIEILKKKTGLELRKREFIMDEGYCEGKVISDTAFCIPIENWQRIKDNLYKIYDKELPEHKHDVQQWRKGAIWNIVLEEERVYYMDIKFEGDQTEEFEAFCQYIFKLAHFEGFRE